jgi:O-acetyl-ADP-ribose deacetylase (regulator of RNase III)
MPALSLHANDGNHSNAAGAYLSSLMLYAAITGKSTLGLPALENGVDAVVQEQLARVAAETVKAVSPRQHCPADGVF